MPEPTSSPGEGRPFQILSLDGGGLKGLFSAAILAELEADLHTSIADHFDLIVGTSTGGLIALGLGMGIPPAEMVTFYVTDGPKIFGRGRRWPILRAKHQASRLRAALEVQFGTRQLWESSVRLVIPSYSLDSNDVYLFKTPHHPRLIRDYKERVVDIALATSAAPTFLPVARLRNNRLVDGGLWANNPALVGVVEAHSMLGAELSQIRVLSLGTTEAVEHLSSRLDNGGLLPWARKGKGVLLRAPTVGAFHMVEHLVPRENVARIDASVPDGLFGLDNIDSSRVRALAEDIARRQSEAITPYLKHVPAEYTPMRTDPAVTVTPS